MQGDVENVREDIHLVNTILPMGKYTRSTPLIVALASENREMIDLILECRTLQVSTEIITSDERSTVFHVMAMYTVPIDICRRILNHPTLDTKVLNIIDHDDYRPLDLALEYHPDLVPFLKTKGAMRYWRVGPGFKPNPNEPM
ncbi:MAG: hypothetical protein CMC93_05560 [Flavobacteriaceae bacterium]|nr:hypothetical protein [Flavobacteriaceae bacterium]